MSKQTQAEAYLMEGHSLTQEQARAMWNYWRLAVCINRMREYPRLIGVITELVGDSRHAQYYIPKKEIARIRKSRTSKAA
jgi:hypothetical protein